MSRMQGRHGYSRLGQGADVTEDEFLIFPMGNPLLRESIGYVSGYIIYIIDYNCLFCLFIHIWWFPKQIQVNKPSYWIMKIQKVSSVKQADNRFFAFLGPYMDGYMSN